MQGHLNYLGSKRTELEHHITRGTELKRVIMVARPSTWAMHAVLWRLVVGL
jgi:hypothetical protein